MKFAFILLAFVFSFGAFAQDPCNKDNILNLIEGYKTQFYSRKQANDCLLKAKSGGVPNISVTNTKNNLWAFKDTTPKGKEEDKELERVRYLKLNKKDFFINKTILGKYKVTDREEDGNKVSSNDRFVPKACVDPSPSICGSKNPPQDFDADTCTCVDKAKTYCGTDKNWSFDKKEKAKNKCDPDTHTWDDETCECTKVTIACGDEKWNPEKYNRKMNACLGEKKANKGYVWDVPSCSCIESTGYCGGRTLKQLQKDEKSCPKGQKWDDDTCACITDGTKFSCNGKIYDETDKKSCEEKSTEKVTFSWVEEPECKCVKEKVTVLCEGENVGKTKVDRKQQRCLDRMAKDPRWSWDETKCDCVKEDETKEKLCGEKEWSQNKYDRVSKRCKGTWDSVSCECDEGCYEKEEPVLVDNETCTDVVPKLGDVDVKSLVDKICDKAIPQAEIDLMKASCANKVDAIWKKDQSNGKITPIEIDIDYTLKDQVICDDKVVAIKSEKDIKRSLPSNIPTTDPKAYTGGCPGTATLAPEFEKFHPDPVSCEKMQEINAGQAEIEAVASQPFDEFFKQLNVSAPVTKEAMDAILKDAKFNLEVIGTANRSNNGTGITLDELATKRKTEAERIMIAEMNKKLSAMVGADYVAPSSLFTNTGGVAQAVGPLNPAATYKSMMSVINEPGSAKLKEKCGTIKNKTDLFKCSVDYFIDEECPTLAPTIKDKLCDENLEAQRTSLKTQTNVDFLKEFKMFQIGVDMKTNITTPVLPETGTVKVKCKASPKTEETTEGTTTVTEMLKVTKPGFFRRMSKECREERKKLNEEFGRKNVRKAANSRKNPNGVVMRKTTGTSDTNGNVIIPTTVIENNYPKTKENVVPEDSEE